MSNRNRLLQQAARARRLMNGVSDPVTLEVLELYAKDCEAAADGAPVAALQPAAKGDPPIKGST